MGVVTLMFEVDADIYIGVDAELIFMFYVDVDPDVNAGVGC